MNTQYLKNIWAHRKINMILCLLILREKGIMEKAGVFFIKGSLNAPLKLICYYLLRTNILPALLNC